jgi:hypothetical protein
MGYIICIYSYTKIKEQLQSHILTYRKIHHKSDTKMAIIMLCSSYGAKTMKNKKEIQLATATTRSPEVDYSLFIMVMKVESSEGMEKTPAAPRRSFPLQSSISLASISCFYVLAALSLATRRGTLFIDGFRSRRIHRDKDRRHQSNEVGTGRPHVAQTSGHVGHACFLLGPPLLHFLLSEVLFREKTGPRKVSGNLDFVWVPES